MRYYNLAIEDTTSELHAACIGIKLHRIQLHLQILPVQSKFSRVRLYYVSTFDVKVNVISPTFTQPLVKS